MSFKIYFSALVVLFFAVLIWGAVHPVHAQQQFPNGCGPRLAVMEALKKNYGMEARWFGIESSRASVSMLLVNKAGAWVSLRLQPEVACIVASGEDSTLMFGQPV